MKFLCVVLSSVFCVIFKAERCPVWLQVVVVLKDYVKEIGQGHTMGRHGNPIDAFSFLAPEFLLVKFSGILGNYI